MFIRFFLILLLHLLISTKLVLAKGTLYDPLLSKCSYMRFPEADQESLLFGFTNNLATNEITPAPQIGPLIIIQGRLLDESCVPISDAKIYAYQSDLLNADNLFYHDYDSQQLLLEKRELTGAGTAISNNLGLFTLVTTQSHYSSNTPTLNISIYHSDFEPFFTKISVADRQNIFPLNKVYPDIYLLDKNSTLYRLDIIFEGLNKYRRF